jgi:hypothetical protein
VWAGYAQLVPPVVPETSVGVIRVFATAEEYTAYVGAEHAWTSGLWNPFKQELTIRPNDWGGSREKENHLLRVVYHEAFHQYLFLATGGIQAAAWFNEGHASLFENARIAGGRLDVEEDPARLAVLMEMIQGSKANLKELLPLTYQEFYAGDNQQRQERYALAWALVYYLRKGAAAERTPYAHQVCQRYLEALIQTKDGDAATRAAFDGIDLARLTADFTRFWLSNHKRAKADRNRVVK